MEWAARTIGVFYVLGGLMLVYQAWMNWRLQRALSGVLPISLTEQTADAMVGLGGVLVLLAGLALAVLSAWAVAAFLAGWSIQAGYLLWANRWFRPRDVVAFGGRRRALDAFVIYTVITGIVIWLPMAGILG